MADNGLSTLGWRGRENPYGYMNDLPPAQISNFGFQSTPSGEGLPRELYSLARQRASDTIEQEIEKARALERMREMDAISGAQKDYNLDYEDYQPLIENLLDSSTPAGGIGLGIKSLREAGWRGSQKGIPKGSHKWGRKEEIPYEGKWTEMWSKNALDVANTNGKTRTTVLMVSPAEFLSWAEDTTTGKLSPDKIKNIRTRLAEGTKMNSLPGVTVKVDKKGVATVVSHDGRHRALEAIRRNIPEIPIEFTSTAGREGNSIRWFDQDSPLDVSDHWPQYLQTEGSDPIFVKFPIPDQRMAKVNQPRPELQPHMVRSAAKEGTPRYTYDINQDLLPPVAGSKPALVKDFGEAKEKKEVSAFHKRMMEDIQKKNIEWRKQVESTNYKFKEGDIYKGSNGVNYKIIAKTLYKKNNKTPAVPAYRVEGADGETTTLIEGLMKPESIYTGPKK